MRTTFDRLALLFNIPDFRVKALGNYELKTFQNLENEVRQEKYLAVRHPIERLLSGWEDKFESFCGKKTCHTTRVSVGHASLNLCTSSFPSF